MVNEAMKKQYSVLHSGLLNRQQSTRSIKFGNKRAPSLLGMAFNNNLSKLSSKQLSGSPHVGSSSFSMTYNKEDTPRANFRFNYKLSAPEPIAEEDENVHPFYGSSRRESK